MICNANRVVFFSHELRIYKKCERTHFQLKTLEYVCGFFSPFKTPSWKNSFTPSLFSLISPPPLQASSVCLFFTVRTTNYWTNWFLYLASYQSVLLAVLHLRGFFCCWCRKSFFFSSLPALCFRARHRLHPPPSPFFFQKSF